MLFGQLCYFSIIAVYCYCGIGTDNCTGGAARAVGVVCLSGEVTVLIGFFRYYDTVFGAYLYAQAAALTALDIYNYLTSHLNLYTALRFRFDSADNFNN